MLLLNRLMIATDDIFSVKKLFFWWKNAGAAYFSAAADLLSPSCLFYCLVVSSIFVNMKLNLSSKPLLLPVNVILGDFHQTNVSFLVFSWPVSSLSGKEASVHQFYFPSYILLMELSLGPVWVEIFTITTTWPSVPQFTASSTFIHVNQFSRSVSA